MRIAYVVGTYPSRSETFIAREIEALEAAGIEVVVFPVWRARDLPPGMAATRPLSTVGWPSVVEQCEHWWANVCWQTWFLRAMCRHPRVGFRALWYLGTAFGIAHVLRRVGVDRVHGHFANLPSTVAWVVASLLGVPFSLSVHARDVFVEPEFLADKARDADCMVACNSAAAKRAAELIDGADRDKVVLVPHGLPVDRYAFREALPDGPPLVLAVGRLVEKKGFVHLVEAMAQLRRRHSAVRCWIAGDGPERDALGRQVAALGLGGIVELKGWLSQDEVRAALEGATALAVPSIVASDGDMDGLPNVVLEAAACGVPLVTTDAGGILDFVADGQTGLVARQADAGDLAAKLDDVLSQPAAAAERTRHACQLVAEHFDFAHAGAELLRTLGIG